MRQLFAHGQVEKEKVGASAALFEPQLSGIRPNETIAGGGWVNRVRPEGEYLSLLFKS